MNAARMARNGEFRKIAYVILVEIRHRLKKVPSSAYEDLTRQIPPNPRPTRTGLLPPPVMKADDKQVAARIQEILADIDIDKANGS